MNVDYQMTLRVGQKSYVSTKDLDPWRNCNSLKFLWTPQGHLTGNEQRQNPNVWHSYQFPIKNKNKNRRLPSAAQEDRFGDTFHRWKNEDEIQEAILIYYSIQAFFHKAPLKKVLALTKDSIRNSEVMPKDGPPFAQSKLRLRR